METKKNVKEFVYATKSLNKIAVSKGFENPLTFLASDIPSEDNPNHISIFSRESFETQKNVATILAEVDIQKFNLEMINYNLHMKEFDDTAKNFDLDGFFEPSTEPGIFDLITDYFSTNGKSSKKKKN